MKLQHETSLIQPGLVSPSMNPSALLLTTGNHDTTIIQDQFTSVGNFNPIEYCTWSQSNFTSSSKLCVYLSHQNQVHVFDTKSYDKKEKFALKPIDRKYSRSSFTVKGFDFSPDGTRLAIGQSDCIIYIYKLGSNQQQQQQQLVTSSSSPGQSSAANQQISPSSLLGNQSGQQTSNRPTITGKFACSSPITCLLWNDAGIVFGTQDGKIKLISTGSPASGTNQDSDSNKVITVMAQQSLAVALTGSKNASNDIVVAGFINGSVILASNVTSSANNNTNISKQQVYGKTTNSRILGQAIQTNNLVDHSCAPFSLCLTTSNHICIGGSDGKLFIGQIYQQDTAATASQIMQQKDQQASLSIKSKQILDLRYEIQKIDCSPSSDVIVVATGDRLLIVKLDSNQLWRICYSVHLKNAIMITSLLWSPDGSQMIAGTLNGGLELFSCQWNRRNINDKFEISYIGKNQITIKNIQTLQLCAVIKSKYDITHPNNIRLIQNGQYAIVWTSHTLILVRLADVTASIGSKMCELDWSCMSTQNLRFCFDYMNVVAISLAGEIMIVELGKNKILYSVRSDYSSRHLISIKGFNDAPLNNSFRMNEVNVSMKSATSLRSFCYMIDAKTLCIVDLQNQTQLCTWSNNVAIDWLELSDSGSRLLFRDRSLQLYHLKINKLNEFRGKNQQVTGINSGIAGQQQVECTNLINSCGFAQWVHDTDVIVAQSSSKIYVWYDLQKPVVYDARSTSEIGDNGVTSSSEAPMASVGAIRPAATEVDIVSIERDQKQSTTSSSNGTTRIILSNGTNIELDMIFIEFDTALRDGDLVGALSFLEHRKRYDTTTTTTTAMDENDIRKHRRQTQNLVSEEQYDEDNKNISSLWRTLADKALISNEIGIAERALAELGEYSKCRYLRSCRQDSVNFEWKLALFKNDWASFETLADMEIVIREYKKLNRWKAIIAYLERMGQYRHKDNLEHEYHKWLQSRGQIVEVARLMAQSGQLMEALQLLLANKRLKFASKLLLESYGSNNNSANSGNNSANSLFLSSTTGFAGNNKNIEDMIQELKEKLVEQGHYEEAAQLCQSKTLLNDLSEALDLYIRANSYSKAIAIARDHYPERVVKLEEEYGDYILHADQAPLSLLSSSSPQNESMDIQNHQQQQPRSAAIDHYLEAGKLNKALKAAMELRQYDKAAQILPSMDMGDNDESIVEFCKILGDHYRSIDHIEDAVSFYKLGQHHQAAIDTYLTKSEFSKAHQVAMDLMADKDKVREMFMLVASQLVSNNNDNNKSQGLQDNNNFLNAEKIYLILGEVDEAIDMYKRFKQYDQMVRLIHDYHPDLLENSLILLGGELESLGDMEKAERYYLMASDSEWKNVVRMYRNANRWQDAFRVCASHEPASTTPESTNSGQSSVKVQIAYWWSKSLSSIEESVRLLIKIGPMIQPVLNYAVECKNFDYALDLVSSKEFKLFEGDNNSSEQLVSKIRLKYASWLEQQGKFDQAEKFLVEAGQISEAVDMYMENEMFAEALRLVEQHPKLQYQTTSSETDNNNLSYRPLIEKVLLGHANHLLKTFKVTQSSLNRSWMNRKSLDDSLKEAQQLYLRANRPDLAVEMYKSRSMWPEALQVARKFAPNLLATIDQSVDDHRDHFVPPSSPLNSRKNSDRLFVNSSELNIEQQPFSMGPTHSGHSGSATMTTNGVGQQQTNHSVSYPSVLSTPESGINLSSEEGQGIMNELGIAIERDERRHVKRLVCRYVMNLINSNAMDKAIKFIYEIGQRCSYIYNQQEVINLIMRLSSEIMSNYQWGIIEERQNNGDNFSGVLELWFALRDTILQVKMFSELEENSSDKYFNNLAELLSKQLMAAHYISLHYCVMEVFLEQQQINNNMIGDEASFGMLQSALNLLASISTALLRYTDIISVDRAFYVAGFWCKTANKLNMAYIFWNHLLDLLEAIESKSGSSVVNEAFKNTDIPTNITLPQRQFPLANQVKGQVQDWVLQTLLELSSPPSLSRDSRDIYEASLQKKISASNTRTSPTYLSCLISGYPILDPNESIQFKEGRLAARHSDWNAFISLLRRSSTATSSQSLSRILDFISQLAGTDRKSIEEYKFGSD